MQLIDLTHTLSNNVPTFDGCGFHLDVVCDYESSNDPVKFKVQAMTLRVGTGTHLDAPAHIQFGKTFIDEILLTQLFAPLVMIDVSKKANETYLISTEDIFEFENLYGKIPANNFVVFYTGWDKHWPKETFRNNLQFPTIHKDAAELLFARGIIGLGIDTLSPDHPESGYPVHALLLGNNKLILECINQANLMPPTGGHILIAPIKIKGGTEAPARVFGVLL